MKKFFKAALAISILSLTGTTWASTLRVHPTEGDYHSINEAMNGASDGDEILVAPGTYEVTETVIDMMLHIRSEMGPEVTVLKSTGGAGVRFTGGGSGSSISGFLINGNGPGIEIEHGTSDILIKNNIISGSSNDGIYLYIAKDDISDISGILIENNTIVANGGDGILFCNYKPYYTGRRIKDCTIRSNIVAKNNGTGIKAAAYNYPAYSVSNVTFYNNNINGNGSSVVVFKNVTEEKGNIFTSPKFVNTNTGNYRLKSTSRCINAGVASPIFNDPDGSRNDIGAFGGPGAAAFWSPLGVPVITEFSVTPSSVSQGGTITLKATGTVLY